jgi:hypothetical protein
MLLYRAYLATYVSVPVNLKKPKFLLFFSDKGKEELTVVAKPGSGTRLCRSESAPDLTILRLKWKRVSDPHCFNADPDTVFFSNCVS